MIVMYKMLLQIAYSCRVQLRNLKLDRYPHWCANGRKCSHLSKPEGCTPGVDQWKSSSIGRNGTSPSGFNSVNQVVGIIVYSDIGRHGKRGCYALP